MEIIFVYCGEVVADIKDWRGPSPQVGYKVVLEEDDFEKYEIIRCTIDITKPNTLVCHIDNI